MITLLLTIVEALMFTLTVARSGDHVTLRYPTNPGIVWTEVCVESEGRSGRLDDPNGTWYKNSCWEPANAIEDYALLPGALHVRAHLTVNHDGQRVMLDTPVWQVRPEPGDPQLSAAPVPL